MTKWHEPIEELALAAWELAPKLCSEGHGCTDYHRAWGLVRWLVGKGRLPAGRTFFEKEIENALNHQKRRILVSGGADSGLSTLVLLICRSQGIDPDMVFVDRCATACEMNRRLARSANAQLTVIQADVTDLDLDPFDLIVAHSFLIFFEGAKRQLVLDAWYRNCRKSGRVLMSNVLKESEDDWVVQKDPLAIQDNLRTFEKEAQSFGIEKATIDQMLIAAERFWKISPGHPPGLTEENLRLGLMKAGFSDVEITYNTADAFKSPVTMVRDRSTGKRRAEILAIK